MPTIEQEQRYTNLNTQHEIEALHKENEDLQKRLASLEKDRESAMRWGIIVLGGAVMAMGTWIFNFILMGRK